MQHRSSAEEQQALEHAVVPYMKQTASEPERDQIRTVEGAADQRDADAHRDDADVLDAVVREQALEVVLADRERDAEHARDQAEREHHDAPPQRRIGEQRREPEQAGRSPS